VTLGCTADRGLGSGARRVDVPSIGEQDRVLWILSGRVAVAAANSLDSSTHATASSNGRVSRRPCADGECQQPRRQRTVRSCAPSSGTHMGTRVGVSCTAGVYPAKAEQALVEVVKRLVRCASPRCCLFAAGDACV
jgi:hypothetical protein